MGSSWIFTLDIMAPLVKTTPGRKGKYDVSFIWVEMTGSQLKPCISDRIRREMQGPRDGMPNETELRTAAQCTCATNLVNESQTPPSRGRREHRLGMEHCWGEKLETEGREVMCQRAKAFDSGAGRLWLIFKGQFPIR